MIDNNFGYYMWSWYLVWISVCGHYLMLSHFHEELHKGRGRESCDTRGSKLSKCFNGKYTAWNLNWKKKKKQNGQYYTAWLSEAIVYSKLFLVLFLFRFIWVFLWKGLTMFYCCIFAYSALLMAWYKIWEYVPELWLGFGPTTVEGIDWQRKPQLYF